MEIKAAVTQGPEKDLVIENVELDQPKADEVLIKVVASGICHTDLVARDTTDHLSKGATLGHEGAGEVVAVGDQVTYVEEGDHVVMTALSCEQCESCRTGHPGICENHMDLNFRGTSFHDDYVLHQGDQDLKMFFGQSSFATYTTVNVNNIVKVSKDLDLTEIAPLGCGIHTGAGTILNRLKPEYKDTVMVLGMGGVGLSAVMASKIANAKKIIAVDLYDSKLDLAQELGATHVINTKDGLDNFFEEVRAIDSDGPKYIVDTTGYPALVEKAIEAMKFGGTIALLGAAFEIKVDNSLMEQNKTVLGFTQGDSNPKLFFPELLDYYQKGEFPMDKLITKYPFEDINQAIEAQVSGEAIKPVLVM